MKLRCRSHVRGDAVILSVGGVLDGAEEITKAVTGVMSRSRLPVVIDLGGLWSWTEAGQQALASAARISSSARRPALCALPGHLPVTDPELARVVRHDTVAAALSAVRAVADPTQLPRARPPTGPGAVALRQARRDYLIHRESVPRVRRWAMSTLTGWDLADLADRAALPLSEITTQALLYGRGDTIQVTAAVWRTPAFPQIAVVGVQDANPYPPVMDLPELAELTKTGGPGRSRPDGSIASILRATTDGCGWHPTPGAGKTVWFTLIPAAPDADAGPEITNTPTVATARDLLL